MNYARIYKSEIGDFLIRADGYAVFEISLLDPSKKAHIQEKANKITELAITQLDEYFNKKRTVFSFPIRFVGATDFQLSVWEELMDIDYGFIATYKDIAESIGHPKAYRAVGKACNKNPLLLVVPCHRVLASGNKIGGFAYDKDIKRYLLYLENC